VTEALVRHLLADQHPDLARLPLRLVANGWDNVIFRLGSELTVRLPRRRLAADLVAHEQRWLPELAVRMPIPIPAPVRVGIPDEHYPWRWSICPWFGGDVAADVELGDPVREARRLGAFAAALHTPAPSNAPVNPFRGHPISEIRPRIAVNVEGLRAVIDPQVVLTRFDECSTVEPWSGPPQWLHGDLHTANVLVSDGAISAVIDFGDITSGDPAVDLAIAWMLFEADARSEFRRAAGVVDDATWARAQAWALHFGVMYLLHSADSERFERMGTGLLARVLNDQ